MDDESECECEECEEGAPAWLATFADLMSLLMCFFVLLLSFSEIDVQKYKQVAGSMKFAFGIQREVPSDSIPKGTSVIAQEYTPGTPDKPSILDEMNQETVDDSQEQLKIDSAVAELLEQIMENLQEEVDADVIELVVNPDGVMLRVREADAFPSGSAELQSGFKPVLDKLQSIFDDIEGRIIVSGHTDNVPISTSSYPSNWVLSAARAASVVHYLAEIRMADPSKIEIRAFADTQPVAPNDTFENRAKNRRIEINISVPEED